MQAIVQDKYGSAEVLHLREIETARDRGPRRAGSRPCGRASTRPTGR